MRSWGGRVRNGIRITIRKSGLYDFIRVAYSQPLVRVPSIIYVLQCTYSTTLKSKIMDQSQSSVYHAGSKEGSDLEEVSEGGGSWAGRLQLSAHVEPNTNRVLWAFWWEIFQCSLYLQITWLKKLSPISDYAMTMTPPPHTQNTRKSPVACISSLPKKSFNHLMTSLFIQNRMIFLLSGKLLLLVHCHHVGVDFQSSGQTATALSLSL